jgi:3-alpha domain/2Fe-2S iron-sulfur cluster binding domain/MOSC domain
MTVPPVLLSVNVGLPKNVAWQGKTVYTGAWKHPVDGPAMVRRLNIDGDGQGDLAGHGGEQRAVLVYQVQSYRHWQLHLGRDDLGYGQFGENLGALSVADTDALLYLPGRDRAKLRAAVRIPALSPGWQQSFRDLLAEGDVPSRWSCRSGVCHTCATPLLSGSVSYAPDPLEPPADGEVLICCARPSGDIVLDM